MTFLAFFIGFGYAMLVLILAMEGFTYRPKTARKSSVQRAFTGFSIIINFRNEEKHLPQLLKSISALNYDPTRMQFIFVNDASQDHSLQLLQAFVKEQSQLSIHVYDRNPISASAKKDGITQALEHATYQHIITTDADCVLPQNWLTAYENHYKHYLDSVFVAAPVQITAGKSVIEQVQASEMIALQLMTAGGFSIGQPFLCNGANMSFTKSHFNEVNGYKGNDRIASGDDIFLLEKSTALNVTACYYLKSKDAIVTTSPKTSWQEMISQRARWAQKGAKTKSLLNKLVSAQVFAANLFILLVPVMLLVDFSLIKAVSTVVTLKVFTDLLVLTLGYQFFTNPYWKWYVIPQLLLYPFIVVAVAIKSVSEVRWKGRAVAR